MARDPENILWKQFNNGHLIIAQTSNPKQLCYLQSIDVMCCDESGQISSEMWAVIDIILRTIKNTSIYFGGVKCRLHAHELCTRDSEGK